MKKRYSFQHLKTIALGATVALWIAPAFSSSALAADQTINSDVIGPYNLAASDSLVITPSGSITANNGSFGITTALGVIGSFTGSITNNGTITATGNASSGSRGPNPVGIFINGPLGAGASITNTGTISATATGVGIIGSTVFVGAYGIVTADLGAGSAITNTGTITATSTCDGLDASYARVHAYGISSGDLDAAASITNSGNISATALGDGISGDIWANVEAAGILTDSLGEGASITNSGTITATATGVGLSGDNPQVNAYGIQPYITDSLGEGASITNTGTITATATGVGLSGDYPQVNAYGIQTPTLGEGASIANSGTITATATDNGDHGELVARGVHTSLGSGSSLTNDGTITATASGFSGAAAGIKITNVVHDGASIVNNGTILASFAGAGPSVYAAAYGIDMANLNLNDTITNNGTITAIAPVNDDAYSIYLYDSTGGTIINNGTLNGNIHLESDPGASGINLNNNGTLAIPALAAGQTGWIGGNYTQSAAGTFKVGVTSGTEYGRLNVGGTATMPSNANIQVDVASTNTLVKGEVLTILNAGLLSGSTYNVTDNSLPWQFTAAGMNNTLALTVAEPTGMSSYAEAVTQAGFWNVAGVAAVLDDFSANGSPSPAFDDLIFLLNSQSTPADLANELSKLQPLLGGAVSQVTIGSMRSASRIIQSRLSGGSEGLSFGDELQPDRRMWAKPFGSWLNQDDADGIIGYDASTYGVVLGADTDISNSGYRLGMAFAYAASDMDSNSDVAPQSTDIDSYQLAFYGSYNLDKLTELSFQADIGTSNYDGSRTLNFSPSMYSVATADYDSTNYHLGAGIERDIRIDERNTFTPSARVDYTAIDLDSYTEQGPGGYNLNVDGQTVDELIFSVDGEFSHKWSATTSLTANVGLGLDAINDQASIASSFVAGGPAFVTNGSDPSALLMRGGLGVEMEPVSGIELVTRYDLEAREDFENHTVSIKLRMPF